MDAKYCTTCLKLKSLKDFHIMTRRIDGHKTSCKTCCNLGGIKYKRTKKGLITDLYRGQRYGSRKNGYEKPNYSLNELRDWVYNQSNFINLFSQWINSGYEKLLRPSCDRINDYLPYTPSNIQLTTWGENKLKGHTDRKNGINNKCSNKVAQINKNNELVNVFPSHLYASRKTLIDNSHIGDCCNGKRKSAGGFKWAHLP